MDRLKVYFIFLVFMGGLFACTVKNEIDIPETLNEFKPSANALVWAPGHNDFNESVNGVSRNFVIHIPASYKHEAASVPLLFMLHGSDGTGDRFYNISGWVEKSDVEGFIVVFPTGYEYPIQEKGGKLSNKWNDRSLIEEVVPGTVLQDDVFFMQYVIKRCQESFHIDTTKRYITGFSNGGGFVRDKIIGQIPEVFAATATGGGLGVPEIIPVKNDVYPPLFCILGTKDNKIVESSGIEKEIPISGADFMQEKTFRIYLDAMLATLKLDTLYTEISNPPAYNILTFDKQKSTQTNEYKLMLVNDLDHNFPNGKNNKFNVSGPDILWPWFQKWKN